MKGMMVSGWHLNSRRPAKPDCDHITGRTELQTTASLAATVSPSTSPCRQPLRSPATTTTTTTTQHPHPTRSILKRRSSQIHSVDDSLNVPILVGWGEGGGRRGRKAGRGGENRRGRGGGDGWESDEGEGVEMEGRARREGGAERRERWEMERRAVERETERDRQTDRQRDRERTNETFYAIRP